MTFHAAAYRNYGGREGSRAHGMARNNAQPWRARWRPPNVQFTQFIAIQGFLVKLNDKYNINKYINAVEYL